MSGATYRIETVYVPQYRLVPWRANAYRLSDDERVAWADGATEEEAISEIRQSLRLLVSKPEGHTLYVFDDGTDAPEPHSVKA